MSNVITRTGVAGSEQMAFFSNATITAYSDELEVSIATKIIIPPEVIAKGEGAVAEFARWCLEPCSGAVEFQVQIGPQDWDQ